MKTAKGRFTTRAAWKGFAFAWGRFTTKAITGPLRGRMEHPDSNWTVKRPIRNTGVAFVSHGSRFTRQETICA